VPDEGHPALLSLQGRRFAHCGAQGERLEHDGTDQDGDGHHRAVDLVRVQQLLDALVQRKQPTEGEQDQRHEEAVDVTVPTVTERVLLGGGTSGPLATEQQQALVAGVDQRVDTFGEHG
jgi:hypothetical protein